ncbi:MAG: WYL domain-containing protein [Minicystis sp.]
MKRLHRLMAIALLLTARRRLRARELAEQFGVNERTVYRDVRALQAAGFVVEGTAGDGYRVPQDAFLRPLALSEPEAESLALAAQMLRMSADDQLRETLATATAKLESALSPEARRRVRQHRSDVVVGRAAGKRGGPIGVVLEALRRRQVLRISYTASSTRETTDREVEPLGVVLFDQAWMLVAFCRLRQDVRGFRVDRIRRAAPLPGEPFAPRPGLSFADVVAREHAARANRAAS